MLLIKNAKFVFKINIIIVTVDHTQLLSLFSKDGRGDMLWH